MSTSPVSAQDYRHAGYEALGRIRDRLGVLAEASRVDLRVVLDMLDALAELAGNDTTVEALEASNRTVEVAERALRELVDHVPEWSRLDGRWTSQRIAGDALKEMGEVG